MACSRRSLLMTMAMAVASACTTAWDTVSTAAATVYTVCARVANWVFERVATAVPAAELPQAPRVAPALVQARAFVLRLAKRETPRLTPGWRMCPSI